MVFGLDPEAPLVVGANRDERLDRRATAMTVLRESGPRILGGRDEVAGGTWLAVNSHGLVAGLTNRPLPDGPDPSKRSRGELPLALAAHRRADDAVEEFVKSFKPADYNPAWFLVGDRQSLYAIDLTDGESPMATRLGPGVHILENTALTAPSVKVDHVRALLGPGDALRGDALVDRLRRLLADHSTPDATATAETAATGPTETTAARTEETKRIRPPETLAACVHTENYGTRSSSIISVPADENALPRVLCADGHPCETPFLDAGTLWSGS